jgi:hypothetical protein
MAFNFDEMKATFNEKGFHVIDYTKKIKKLQDFLEIYDKMKTKNDDGSFKYASSIIVIRMGVVSKKLPMLVKLLMGIGENPFGIRLMNKDNYLSFMDDKTPNNCVIENFLHQDEEVMCEVCCEMVESSKMNVCANCVYKCCEKCFNKKYLMSIKAGTPDGRCFGCRDELVLGIIEISA